LGRGKYKLCVEAQQVKLSYPKYCLAAEQMKIPKTLNVSKSAEIQMLFPHEPEWRAVEYEVLVTLVKEYADEQSCASSAMTELALRKSADLPSLCLFLLNEEGADRYLKVHAFELLLTKHFQEGIRFALAIVDTCSSDMLAAIVEALNYELQGDLRDSLLHSDIIKHVAYRLSTGDVRDVSFSQDFFDHI
jgi:hypothetical protein